MSLSTVTAAFLILGTPQEGVQPLPQTPAATVQPAPAGEGQISAPITPVAPPPVVLPTLPAISQPVDPMQTQAQPANDGDIVVTARHRPPPGDPFEGLNMGSYQVTQSIDKAFVGPVAMTYKEGVPHPVRKGLRNFLNNLTEPVVFLNYLLQFKPGKAAETVGRFAVNSTLGLAGLVDVAKRKPFYLPYRPNGFANTLGYYGVKPGPFFFVPLVGATTLRDMIGDAIDVLTLPAIVGSPFNKPAYAIPATVIKKLNDRVARDEEIRRLQTESANPYAETRTLYLEMRRSEIEALHGRHRAVAPPPVVPTKLPYAPVTDIPSPADVPATETTPSGTTAPSQP